MSYLDYIRYSIAKIGKSYLLPSARTIDAYFNNFSGARPIFPSPRPTDLVGDISTLYTPTARTTYLCFFLRNSSFMYVLCKYVI
jgi:hypothetical protein